MLNPGIMVADRLASQPHIHLHITSNQARLSERESGLLAYMNTIAGMLLGVSMEEAGRRSRQATGLPLEINGGVLTSVVENYGTLNEYVRFTYRRAGVEYTFTDDAFDPIRTRVFEP